MPVRASSTPSLTSWLIQHQNPKILSPRDTDFIHRTTISFHSSITSNNSPKHIIGASSDGDLVTRSSHRNPPNSANYLIENSGFMFWSCDLDVNDGCGVQFMMDGGDGGHGGGKICGDGDDDGDFGYGGDGTDVYYQNMIEANPNNSMILGNYAKYLKEVQGDSLKAEEYCIRAILANPSDATTLSMYADLIWETQNDAPRAESYFDQAVKASPNDSYVMAAYARFLWDADEEVSDTNLAAPSFIHEASLQFPIAAPS